MSQDVTGLISWLRSWFDDIYQSKLVSGTNIKTINSNSLLGSGNINISGSVTVDTSLSTTSTNPVQNKVIANALNNKQDISTGLTQVKQRVWSSTINLTYTLYVDETNRHCSLTITGSSISIASGGANYELTGWIPSEYRPKANKFTMLNRSQYFQFYAWNNGNIGISNFASTTQSGQGFSGEVDWNY